MTVFVVQENPRNDYAPAEEYGEIEFITADEYSPVKSSIMNTRILESIESAMRRYNPDRDFVVLTGNPVVMGYTVFLALKEHGFMRFLQWDRMSGGYRQSVFDRPLSTNPDSGAVDIAHSD